MHPYLKTARKWYRIETRLLDRLRDVLFLVIRLYFGHRLILSGQGKLANPDETAKYFSELQIPMPELNAFMAGATELVGGLFLALGLASRLSAVPVLVVMFVAYMTAHTEEWAAFWTATPKFIKAPPFPYLFTAAMVLVCGPGRFSVDYLVGWFLDRKEEAASPTEIGNNK